MRPFIPIVTILSAALLAAAACGSPYEAAGPTDTPASTPTAVGDVSTVTPPPVSTAVATVTPLPTSTAAPPAQSPTPTEEDPDFRPGPEDVITLLPFDAIKAILEPRLVSVEWAEQQMNDMEQVIGVSIGGEHRAYPIYMLSSHEIVNDTVGGKPIAVTW